MDPVVHFELPADDLARAQRFYREAFGWSLAAPPGMRYVFATTAATEAATMRPTAPGTINGGMLERRAPVLGPTITIQVADIEAAFGRLAEAGGTRLAGPIDVGAGLTGYFRDPEGNVLGLFQPKR